MPRNRARGKAKAAPPAAPQEPLLTPDPEWVDLQAVPGGPTKYKCFNTPREFYDGMVADAPSWALGADPQTVRSIASAVARTVIPWIADAQHWREHLGDFCSRLCAHRQHRAATVDARLEHLEREQGRAATIIERQEGHIAALDASLRALETRLVTAERTLQCLQETALLRPTSVIREEGLDRVRRAQLRAVSSRSPDPRTALSAMRRVEQMDRRAMARHETTSCSWDSPPSPSAAHPAPE